MSVSISASLLKQLLVRSFVVCFIKNPACVLSDFVYFHPDLKHICSHPPIKQKQKQFGVSLKMSLLKGKSKTLAVAVISIHQEQINARPSHGNVNFNSLRKGFKNNPKIKGRTVRSQADPASVSFLKTTRHVAPRVWPFT